MSVRLTRDQVSIRRDELGGMMCYIIDGPGSSMAGQYWRTGYSGYSSTREGGCLFPCSEALDNTGLGSLIFEFPDLNPPPPARMTVAEARGRISEIGANSRCIITIGRADSTSVGRFYLSRGNGTTPDRTQAWIYTVNGAIDCADGQDIIELLDVDHPVQVPVELPDGSKRILLTRNKLKDNLSELDRKHCFIVQKYSASCEWFKEPFGSGTTIKSEERLRMTPKQCLDYNWNEEAVLYELVDQELAAKIAAKRCTISQLLPATLIELLKLAPLNPTARARVLAITGHMPSDTLATYDALRDWIETNVEPRSVRLLPVATPGVPAPPPPPDYVPINVRLSETEVGHCNYTVARWGDETYFLTNEALGGLIPTEGNIQWTDFLLRVKQHIINTAHEVIPDAEGENYENYEYDDYETTDTTNQQVRLANGEASLQTQLLAHLRRTQPAEVLRRLGVTP